MLVRLFSCVAMLSTGCDLLFKIDHVEDTTDGGQAHPLDVSGTFQRRQLRNAAGGSPKLMIGLASGVTAVASFRDGSSMQVAIGADGTFSFHAPDTPYTLTITTDVAPHIFQLSSANVALFEEIGGRDQRTLPPMGTQVRVDLSNRSSSTGAVEELQTTGVWTRTTLTGSSPILIDWTQVAPLSGPSGLLLGTEHDGAYYAGYEKGTFFALTKFQLIRDVSVSPGTSVMSFGANTVNLDRCANITLDSAEIARVGAYARGASAQGKWAIVGAGAQEAMPDVYFPLVGDAIVVGQSPGSVNFANPYDGLAPFLRMEVVVDGSPGASTVVSVPLASTCSSPTIAHSTIVKLVTNIVLAGVSVTGQQVVLDRSHLIPITWTPSDDGAVDYWVVSVNDQTAGTAVPIVTTNTFALLDPNLFPSGHMYVLTVTARLGSPKAITGDFTPGGTTVARGRTTTAPFVVQ